MQYLSKVLVTSGLVILTGPFCLLASGQTYIDVEAERAAAASGSASPEAATPASSSATADPYAVKPAQSYPATSYGVGAAPAAAPVGSPSGPVGQTGQNLGNLFYQIQQLQQEVMRLNGKVEEQAHELRKLKEQSLQRYVDLDRRVSGAGPAPAAAAGASAAASGVSETVASPTLSGSALSGSESGAAEQPGEAEAYRAAYALVRGQQFKSAVAAFKQFLQDYPEGKYAPNAHYWLGELYLVTEPQDLESSRQSFVLLLDEYPDNSKAPDAMYKLGKVYFLKGNRDRAREYMDRVIRDYGSSNSSAVKLAQDFIAENY